MDDIDKNNTYSYKKFVRVLRTITVIVIVSLFVMLSIFFDNFWLSLIAIPIIMVTEIFD